MWNDFNRRHFGITRVAGVCGILIPIVIFLCLGVAIASSPWFNWTHHALSDLGIQEDTAALFNYGMVLGGILTLVFSLGLMKILSNKIGAYFLVLSSFALIGIGVFPETVFALHCITSASFFVLLTIGLLVFGLTIKQNSFERGVGGLAFLFALLAISSTVLLLRWEGIAYPEALSCFPGFIWCSLVGFKMVRS